MMDSEDVVDDVNALLKMGVGDPYRLEHIKQAYIQNKTIWASDSKYLQHMREKYLVKHSPDLEPSTEDTDYDPENKETIHCWKCGKKSPLGANFCMTCGASLFEVGATTQTTQEQTPPHVKQSKPINLKIPIMIGIPVLILIIIGGAYSQGYLDNALEKNTSDDSADVDVQTTNSDDPLAVPDGTNSKCGPGTVYDSDTNSCILAK